MFVKKIKSKEARSPGWREKRAWVGQGQGPPSGQDQPRGCGGPTGRLGGGAPDASLVVPVRMSVAPGLPVPPRTPDAAERRGAVCTTLPAACFIDGETETWAEEAVRAESHSCGLERVPRARSSV